MPPLSHLWGLADSEKDISEEVGEDGTKRRERGMPDFSAWSKGLEIVFFELPSDLIGSTMKSC